MGTVFVYGDYAIRNGVPRKFAGTPFIVDEQGKFVHSISQYFLARRNGDYVPGEYSGTDMELRGVRATQCRPVFLLNRAYQLDVCRKWCLNNSIDFPRIDANQLERFASDYERGKVTGSPGIKPSTTNQVLCSAIDFLSYCVVIGLRRKLQLPYKVLHHSYASATRPFSARGRATRSVKHYLVSRRENPKDIVDWLGLAEIEEYLSCFDASHHRLGAEIIFACGLRLAELLDTTISTFPTEKQWRASRKRRYIRVKGKNGKVRDVEVELDIVRKIQNFIETQRVKNLRSSGIKSNKLLVGPNGLVSRRMFQRAIKAVARLAGHEHLCPHMVRHHYAAHFLLRAWEKKSRTAEFSTSLATIALGHELIRLKQNLGHADIETTYGYLNALGYLTASTISDQLQKEIESND